MRPVMIAIWTSGDPVSLSWRWYWVMNWDLTSFARGMTYASFQVLCRSPCPQPRPRGRTSHEPRLYQITQLCPEVIYGSPAAATAETHSLLTRVGLSRLQLDRCKSTGNCRKSYES